MMKYKLRGLICKSNYKMISTLKSDQLTNYITEINGTLYLVINDDMVLFPYKRITMSLNAMFFKGSTHKLDYDDVEINVVLEGALSNLVRMYARQMVNIKKGAKFALENVNATISESMDFQLVQVNMKEARLATNATFWQNTENILDTFVKLYGGQTVQGHWSIKYGKAVMSDEETEMEEENYIDKHKNKLSSEPMGSVDAEKRSFLMYQYNQMARNEYYYLAMPVQYEIGTIQKIINMYDYRSDLLQLEETNVMCMIDAKKSPESLAWFVPHYGIVVGYNSFLTPSYVHYVNELSKSQFQNIEQLLAMRTVTIMMTALPHGGEMKQTLDLIMMLSITPIRTHVQKNMKVETLENITKHIKTKPVVYRGLRRNMICRPILFIECICYCPCIAQALRFYESQTTYFFPNMHISELVPAENVAYKKQFRTPAEETTDTEVDEEEEETCVSKKNKTA